MTSQHQHFIDASLNECHLPPRLQSIFFLKLLLKLINASHLLVADSVQDVHNLIRSHFDR
jgi:hypothetical protein